MQNLILKCKIKLITTKMQNAFILSENYINFTKISIIICKYETNKTPAGTDPNNMFSANIKKFND